MSSIANWLERLGLAEYVDLFTAEQVDLSTLPELSEADLKELGVPLGPRKKILKAILELGNEAVAVATPTSDDAQRRHLTVMFCDLAGSSALSASLDPEDTRRIILDFQDACAGVVARYEGFVARFMGDGVLAYFRLPEGARG